MGATRGRGGGEGVARVPLAIKGLFACLVLVLYGAVMAFYVLNEREAMLREMAALDEHHALQEALKRADLALSNARLAARQSANEHLAEGLRQAVPFGLEAVERALEGFRERVPAVFAAHAEARRRVEELAAQPSPARVIELRQAIEALGREVGRVEDAEGRRREELAREFQHRGERIALTALGLGLGGFALFGGAAALFFVGLAADLRALGMRAKAIVAGYRGAPLEVRRHDEVGTLARDVNQLAADLAAREEEIAQARELRAHREKMAALGAMARGLAHEIGNPLAAISAIAQDGGNPGSRAILEQTDRIARITRQIAQFSGPRTDAPEPVDAGAMVTMVCDFMQFDPRFRATRIEARLAHGLPPLVVVPDQLSEVVMNLVQMGVEGPGGPPPRLEVEIAPWEAGVAIRVSGGARGGETSRRERTRRLVEGMAGAMREAGETMVVTLPATRPGG